jgi:hypothetical protein
MYRGRNGASIFVKDDNDYELIGLSTIFLQTNFFTAINVEEVSRH